MLDPAGPPPPAIPLSRIHRIAAQSTVRARFSPGIPFAGENPVIYTVESGLLCPFRRGKKAFERWNANAR